MRIGIVAGTGVAGLAGAAGEVLVETSHGDVALDVARWGAHDVFFLPRHGRGHALPPHRIAHRANVTALAAARVDRVLAVTSVGSLTPDVPPGAFVVPHDYVDLAARAERTLFDEAAVHVDVSEAYCPETRAALLRGARATGAAAVDGGVYVATPGPRLETRAEVAHAARMGTIVGMTGCPEAALAREAGLCYATLSVVANWAAGLAPDDALSARGIASAAGAHEARVAATLRAAVDALPAAKRCRCALALADARLA